MQTSEHQSRQQPSQELLSLLDEHKRGTNNQDKLLAEREILLEDFRICRSEIELQQTLLNQLVIMGTTVATAFAGALTAPQWNKNHIKIILAAPIIFSIINLLVFGRLEGAYNRACYCEERVIPLLCKHAGKSLLSWESYRFQQGGRYQWGFSGLIRRCYSLFLHFPFFLISTAAVCYLLYIKLYNIVIFNSIQSALLWYGVSCWLFSLIVAYRIKVKTDLLKTLAAKNQ